jgi:hypothetical protein
MFAVTDKIHPFGGKDILEVLKIYIDIFPANPVFRLAAEEIERLRNEKEKRGKG